MIRMYFVEVTDAEKHFFAADFMSANKSFVVPKMNLTEMYIIKQSNSAHRVNFMNKIIAK